MCYGWGAMSEYWLEIDVFKAWVSFRQISTEKRYAPTNHFCTNRKISKCLTTLLLTVFTQINFIAGSLPVKSTFRRKTAILRFWAPPPLWWLGAPYAVRLRLFWKRTVDFLLLINFLLGGTAEVLRAKTDWKLAFSKKNEVSLAQNFRYNGVVVL